MFTLGKDGKYTIVNKTIHEKLKENLREAMRGEVLRAGASKFKRLAVESGLDPKTALEVWRSGMGRSFQKFCYKFDDVIDTWVFESQREVKDAQISIHFDNLGFDEGQPDITLKDIEKVREDILFAFELEILSYQKTQRGGYTATYSVKGEDYEGVIRALADAGYNSRNGAVEVDYDGDFANIWFGLA